MKRLLKLTALMFTLCIIMVVPLVVKAENNIMYVQVNNDYTDNLNKSGDRDYFRFTLTEPGYLNVDLITTNIYNGNPWSVTLSQADSNWNLTSIESMYAGKTPSSAFDGKRLPAGNYCVMVTSWDFTADSYKLSIRFAPENDTASLCYEKEYNNNIQQATNIDLNKDYKGNLNNSNDVDFFRFNVLQYGKVTASIRPVQIQNSNTWIFALYSVDSNGSLSLLQSKYCGSTAFEQLNSMRLPMGSYAIKISYWYYNNTDYIINAGFTPDTDTHTQGYEREYNDTILTANNIITNKDFTGNLNDSSDKDFYHFMLTSPQKITTSVKTLINHSNAPWIVTLYSVDSSNNLKRIDSGYMGKDSLTNLKEQSLPAGRYAVSITSWYFNNSDYTLNVITGSSSGGSVDPGNNSNPGDNGNNSGTGTTTLKAPSLNAITGEPTAAILNWSSVQGALKYELYRAVNSSTASYTLVTTTTNTYYFDSGLTPGTTYFYKVKAIDASSTQSDFSLPRSITPTLAGPDKINTYATSNYIELYWSKVDGAAGYKIYRYNSSTGLYDYLGAETYSMNYKDTGRAANKSYTYRIYAYSNVDGFSVNGGYKQVTVTTKKATTTSSSTKISNSSATVKSFVNQIKRVAIIGNYKNYNQGDSLNSNGDMLLFYSLGSSYTKVSSATKQKVAAKYGSVNDVVISASGFKKWITANFGPKAKISAKSFNFFKYSSTYKVFYAPPTGGVDGNVPYVISCTKSGNYYTLKALMYGSESEYWQGPYVNLADGSRYYSESNLKANANNLKSFDITFYKSGSKQYITKVKVSS